MNTAREHLYATNELVNRPVSGEVHASVLDSSRFGAAIARVTLRSRDELPAFIAGCRASHIAMAVIRTDTRDFRAAQAIEASGGILCDTLVYFARPLRDDSTVASSDARVRPGSPADVERVVSIAAAAFAGYGGHYHADPRLDAAAADDSYIDWARRSVAVPGVVDRLWVVEDRGTVAGFLTLKVNNRADAEIVLNAIHPDHQRRGLYPALLRTALASSRALGAHRCIVSTQVWNVPLQRVLARIGFEPARSYYTFHLWFD